MMTLTRTLIVVVALSLFSFCVLPHASASNSKKRLWSFGANTAFSFTPTLGLELPTWEQTWFEKNELLSFTISSGLLKSIYSLMQNLEHVEGIETLSLDIQFFTDLHLRLPPVGFAHWIVISIGTGIDFDFKPPENNYQFVAAMRVGYEMSLSQGRLGLRILVQPGLLYGHDPEKKIIANEPRPLVPRFQILLMIGLHSYALG